MPISVKHHSPLKRFARSLLLAIALLGGGFGFNPAYTADDKLDIAGLDSAGPIAALDSDDYQTRQQAAERLARLAEDPRRQTELARGMQAALYRAETTFEARQQLEPWLAALPKVEIKPPRDVPAAELDRLVEQLDGERFGLRVGAAARLEWLARQPEIACQIITRLRPRLRGRLLSSDARPRVDAVLQTARRAWLTSQPDRWRWPALAPGELDHWLDELTRPLPPSVAAGTSRGKRPEREYRRRLAGRNGAEAELLDLLVRDDLTARVKAAIDERLAAGSDEDAQRRLVRLAEWSLPALAIETWSERHPKAVTRLTLGVPAASENDAPPTMFDRADERRAHAASGSALPPGEYPVGVLFPNPAPFRETQFVIHNLPTPRRRLAYEYVLKVDPAERLAALSRRTLDAIAARKRPLLQAELLMLASLDEPAVSRFASKYLTAVGDPIPPDREQQNRIGRGSPYVNLCNLLAEIGTHEAVSGILAAVHQDKILPANQERPDNWPFIATLAILARDPGAEGERLLAEMVPRTDPLRWSSEFPSDVGATAAAILLAMHDVLPEKFGLDSAEDPFLLEFSCPGYRFRSPELRFKVLEWWAKLK
jgi:hypothetical protein